MTQILLFLFGGGGAQIKFWRTTNSKTVTIFSFSLENLKSLGARSPCMDGHAYDVEQRVPSPTRDLK